MKLYYPHKINDFYVLLGKKDLVGFFNEDGLIDAKTAKNNVITAILWQDIKTIWLENKDANLIIENYWSCEVKKHAVEMALISFGSKNDVQDTDNSDLGDDFADLIDYSAQSPPPTAPVSVELKLPVPALISKVYKIIELCLPLYTFDMNGTPIFPSHLLPALSNEFNIKLKDVIMFVGIFILNFKKD